MSSHHGQLSAIWHVAMNAPSHLLNFSPSSLQILVFLSNIHLRILPETFICCFIRTILFAVLKCKRVACARCIAEAPPPRLNLCLLGLPKLNQRTTLGNQNRCCANPTITTTDTTILYALDNRYCRKRRASIIGLIATWTNPATWQ